MMMRVRILFALACLSAGAAAAQSNESSGRRSGGGTGAQQWSLVSAETLGAGNTALHFEAGFPGISAAVLSGQNARFDLGGRFQFAYGSEVGTAVVPGLRLQGLLRFLLGQSGRMRTGLEFEPGIYTYFPRFGGATFGLILPVKFTLAFFVIRDLALHVGIDLPLTFNIVGPFFVGIPIMFGGGLEYFATPALSLTLRLRFGPSIIAISPGAYTTLGATALFGVAVRL